MNVTHELEKLAVLLEGVAVNAEQFAVVADRLNAGEMRGAFLLYAEAVRSTRGYLQAIQKLAETTP